MRIKSFSDSMGRSKDATQPESDPGPKNLERQMRQRELASLLHPAIVMAVAADRGNRGFPGCVWSRRRQKSGSHLSIPSLSAMTLRPLPFACLLAALFAGLLPALAEAEEPLTFEQHVRPILKAHCFQCHGEEEKREANLDLRLVAADRQGRRQRAGDRRRASRRRACSFSGSPPARCRRKARSCRTRTWQRFARWIEQGAQTARPEPEIAAADVTDEERAFWSFQPIAAPSRCRQCRIAHGSQSPIDAFLLAEAAKQQSLRFSPRGRPADAASAALTFDLIGLPPTPEEVEAFLADESPDAYERLIDRLLASPALRRALGPALARRGRLRRQRRLHREGPRAEVRLQVSRLRHPRRSTPTSRSTQFIVEQLAGDELLTPPYAEPDARAGRQADRHRLSAHGARRHRRRRASIRTLARNDVMAETIKIVSHVAAGPDRRLRPVPQPPLRSDPAGRLLPPAGRLRAGLRLEELAAAGGPAGLAVDRRRPRRRPPRSRPRLRSIDRRAAGEAGQDRRRRSSRRSWPSCPRSCASRPARPATRAGEGAHRRAEEDCSRTIPA